MPKLYTVTRYPRSAVTPYSLWRHRKGGLYLVLGMGTSSTDGKDILDMEEVIYWSFTHRGTRTREVSQFLDGRFIPVQGQDELDVMVEALETFQSGRSGVDSGPANQSSGK